MTEGPNGLAWLLAAKIVCCGGLLLAATGALSFGGLAGWLLDGGIAWLAIAALAVALVHLWSRHRSRLLSAERRDGRTAPREPRDRPTCGHLDARHGARVERREPGCEP